MYQLSDSVLKIKGIGQKTQKALNKQQIKTVKDFLLYLPLRYEDRSQIATINQLEVGQIKTTQATIVKTNEYFKNRRRITSAVISDDTGRTKCIWFNNRYIRHKLKPKKSFFFSGKFTKYRTITQPVVEAVKADTIHTGRLVPLYSARLDIPQGTLRRLLKQTTDNLEKTEDEVAQEINLLHIDEALKQLHFPEEEVKVLKSRQRLALEELLSLIKHSEQIKQNWEDKKPTLSLKIKPDDLSGDNVFDFIPKQIPFTLTNDQQTAVREILADLSQSSPMNRLLIGDVGSGKTVVAGIACHHVLKQDQSACLVAPTQILAQQHFATFEKIFPHLPIALLTAKSKPKIIKSKPKLYIGTHAVINQIKTIKPGLIIYDEQHRFGVRQRSGAQELKQHTALQPHSLTMTATPIPRSYMLTIFSHLQASIIEEMPFGTKDVKTWLVPQNKEKQAYKWIGKQLQKNNNPLALIVCPFIHDSDHEAFANVPSATSVFEKLQAEFKDKKIKMSLLHGQMKQEKKDKIIEKLFNQKINLLVTTSIVEVGVDLPNANIIVIKGADRFGLASLHQLRGRVGRQSQASHCLLFSHSSSQEIKKRLKQFTQINDGLKLAKIDLENRGGGDLFGLKQHGFDELKFADWTNLDLIKQARDLQQKINQQQLNWTPLFSFTNTQDLPAAN